MIPHLTALDRPFFRRLGLALIAFGLSSLLLAFLLASVAPARAEGEDPPSKENKLNFAKGWYSQARDFTRSVAWGDVDGDGDLDLAVGNGGDWAEGQSNRVYLNQGGVLEQIASWSDDDNDATFSVAWGDMNDDGYLDLAVGNSGLGQGASNRVYLNHGGILERTAIWSDEDKDSTTSVAWGDVDGDGDLDLAVGNWEQVEGKSGQPNKVYLNHGGILERIASWADKDKDATTSVAWGDVDGDGDLDLAVGNQGQPNKVYLNQGGILQRTAAWTAVISDSTTSVAWGDVNGDGYLDLAVGNGGDLNKGQPNRVYLNREGVLQRPAWWVSTDEDHTLSVSWGDVDGDGDLDLAVGNGDMLGRGKSSKVYLNEQGLLKQEAVVVNEDTSSTTSVAWGDMDGDGDLDLAVGTYSQSSKVYLNQGILLQHTAAWTSSDSAKDDIVESAAWGDVDSDGDLDLVVGYSGILGIGQPNRVYLNQEGNLQQTAAWADHDKDATSSVAWGDVDGDGDLDLAVGNFGRSGEHKLEEGQPNRVYLNHEGTLEPIGSWESIEKDVTYSIAWGDMNGDGFLDLAVGNWGREGEKGQANKVYSNQGGVLKQTADWVSAEEDRTRSVAWGDVDGDGDLDLAVGNSGQPNRVYLNRGGVLQRMAGWVSAYDDDATNSVAWGDVDGDGDLDLATGNWDRPNKVFLNQDGVLQRVAGWVSADIDFTRSVSWGDVDGDGDLDLVVGNWGPGGQSQPKKVYLNQKGTLQQRATWVSDDQDATMSLGLGDVDGDGDLDLAVGNPWVSNKVYMNVRPSSVPFGAGAMATAVSLESNPIATGAATTSTQLAPAAFLAVAGVRQGIIPIHYTLFDPDALPMGTIAATYSLNGGGKWVTAVPTNTLASDLSTLSQQVYTSHVTQPLKDMGVITSSLRITRAQPIVDLDVWLNITHTHAADLQIALESPNGKVVRLIEATDSITGFIETTLDDQAVTVLAAGKAPFTGHYRPVSRLSDLDGDSTKGDWTLRIADGQAGNTGTLLGWALHFNRTTPVEYTRTLSAPARGNVVTSTIIVSTTSPIIDVDVLLNITRTLDHPIIELVSPFTQTVRLVELQGQVQLANTRLSDQVTRTLGAYAPSYTGHYMPVGRLADLDGGNPAGTWTLRVTGAPADPAAAALGEWVLLLQTADGGQHVFYWDVNNSGFFGQSDNVVFRIEAYPGQGATRDGIPGPFQRPFVSTQTYPFRVRGSQVQVISATAPISNAVVYQLPAGQAQGAMLIAAAGEPFRTAPTGYLTGRGELRPGDRLTALYPTDVISAHTPTRLYVSQDNVPVSITGTQTIVSSLVITDIRRFADLDVLVDISHTVGSDLRAVLVAPDGITRTLFATTTSLGDSLIALSFDDQAAAPFSAQTITNTARPAESLALLAGRPLNGIWQLRLENHGQGASTLNGWGLALKVSDLFYTSAAPTISGLDMRTVMTGGVQTLAVSSANPLMIFDLDVALEWDARNDSKYLSQLQFDLKRASEFLYDWSNGQVALGHITVFHDAKRNTFPGYGDAWGEADVRIYATNRLRPNATQGGVVSEPFTDTMKAANAREPNVYTPGQVAMGAVWNRFGDSSGNLGEDWSRTLAHELGHYLLFLDDNYLGSTGGRLDTVDDCTGAMADHYRDDTDNGYGEFHAADSNWDEKCQGTLSAQRTGRSDWETITTFYPALAPDKLVEGPTMQPLGLTQVDFVQPISPTQSLVAPVISLEYGGRSLAQTANARAFLFKANNEWLVDLGRPQLDQVVARGMEAGDRLCVFDSIQKRIGCNIATPNFTPILPRQDLPSDRPHETDTPRPWLAQVRIVPAGKDAVRVEVTGIREDQLHARLFPQDFPASAAITLTGDTTFTATVPLTVTTASGYVHVWAGDAPDGKREIVTDYALGGRPAFQEEATSYARMRALSIARMRALSLARMRSLSIARMRSLSIARMRSLSLGKTRAYASAMSNDGQVILFGDELDFKEGQYVTFQAATLPPPIPAWATLVGQAYWLAVSDEGLDLTKASLSFGYLGSDVPVGEESDLRIHYWNERTEEWQELETNVDTYNNYASAPLLGPGLYALMTSVKLPLQPGWNLVGYPVQGTRPVSEALASIAGQYSMVYGFDGAADAEDHWSVYIPGENSWVNDLAEFRFGQGYWIYINKDVVGPDGTTWLLKGNPETTQSLTTTLAAATLRNPPAVYFGAVSGEQAEPGMVMRAYIGTSLCGEGKIDEKQRYVVKVRAASTQEIGCGTPGALVSFRVVTGEDEQPVVTVADMGWDNEAPHQQHLQISTNPSGAVPVNPTVCRELVRNGAFEADTAWIRPLTDNRGRVLQRDAEHGRSLLLGVLPGEATPRRLTYSTASQNGILLPADASIITLSFLAQTDEGASGRRVQFYRRNWTSPPLLTAAVASNPGWQTVTADLTPLKGQYVHLYFEVANTGSRSTRWMAVDNVSIQACDQREEP